MKWLRTRYIIAIVAYMVFVTPLSAFTGRYKEEPGGKSDKPVYAPGEILVKFREGAEPAAALKKSDINPKGLERVHSIAHVTLKHKKDYKLEKDKEGWYSFLGKKYKEINQIPDEEVFKNAYADMPEAERLLYRSYKVVLPEGMTVEEASARLKDNPDVEYAEPNHIYRLEMAPDDPYYKSSGSWGQAYDDLWGLKKMRCAQAWDSYRGEGVTVAVIDSGVDYNHPDIWDNIWVHPNLVPDANNDGRRSLDDVDANHNRIIEPSEIYALERYPREAVIGWDYVGGNINAAIPDKDPMDGFGHGTHVAGIIAAAGNNGIGIIGASPGARIMALKAGDDKGEGIRAAAGASAIRYAQQSGARVINLSWGGYMHNRTLEEAIDAAYNAGCVIVASAGNEGSYSSPYPANCYNVIAVGASDSNDRITDFSNYGTALDFLAPGEGILSLRASNSDMYARGGQPGAHIVGSNYYYADGTSMASPYVAALAALILSANPALTPRQVEWLLRDSTQAARVDAYPGFFNIYQGYGRIDALNALQRLSDVPTEALPVARMQGWANWSNIVYRDKLILNGIAASSHFVDYVIAYIPFEKIKDPAAWVELYRQAAPISEYGKLCEIDTSVLESGPCIFGLKVNDALYGADYDFVFLNIYTSAREEDGWPVNGAFKDIEPVVADVDGDKYMEIIALGRSAGVNRMYVWRHDGSPALGWQGGEQIFGDPQGSPSVADLDNDGKLEIVVASADMSRDLFAVEVYRSDGSIFSPWPKYLSWQDSNTSWETTPSIGDLDGDGDLEIVVTLNGYGRFKDGMGDIYVFNHDETIFSSGWPVDIPGYNVVHSSAALGDLDGDGKLEIAISAQKNTDQNIGAVFVYDCQGRIFNSGWPAEANFKTYGSPIIGDLENDGLYEVIAVDNEFEDDISYLYVWDLNGVNKPGWPRSSGLYGSFEMIKEPILADVDGDKKPEIIAVVSNEGEHERVGDFDMIYIFNEDGSIQNAWQADIVNNSSPIVGDMDGDNELEIIASDVTGKFWIYHLDGRQEKGWPIWTFRGSNWDQSPFLGDIDKDGKLELVGQSAHLHVWELGEAASVNLNNMWPGYRRDARHTGCYIPPDPTAPAPPLVIDGGDFTVDIKRLHAYWMCGDPESGIVEYRYKITRDSPSGAVIREWTSTGGRDSVIADGLSLTPDTTYYFSVKAKNGAKLWSDTGYSDGIRVFKANSPPAVGGLSPAGGIFKSGNWYGFITTFYDSDDANDLARLSMLISATANFTNASFYAYYDKGQNKLWLFDGSRFVGGYSPGSNNMIQTRYGRINCKPTSVSASKNVLTVNWAVSFNPLISGARNIYLRASDSKAADTGWQVKGTIKIK